MSYGILATGADLGGEFTIADTDLNLINLAVSIKGRGSSFTLPVALGTGFIFVKNPSVSREFYKCNFSGNQVSFIGFDTLEGGNPTTIDPFVDDVSVAMDFFVLQQLPALSATGTYGLQIFTSAGALAFDSRRFLTNESCEIVQVAPPYLPTNYNEDAVGELTLTNPTTDYVNIEWSRGGAGNGVRGIYFSGDRRYYYDADINEYQDGSEFLKGNGNYTAFIAARLR